jgi:hypothetical protein
MVGDAVRRELGLFCAFAPRPVPPGTRPARLSRANWLRFAYSPVRIGFVCTTAYRPLTTDYRLLASFRTNHKSSIISHKSELPLPRGSVAGIVPKFCARAGPQNRATPYARRNKRFFARGVFYLLNCCTNVVVSYQFAGGIPRTAYLSRSGIEYGIPRFQWFKRQYAAQAWFYAWIALSAKATTRFANVRHCRAMPTSGSE